MIPVNSVRDICGAAEQQGQRKVEQQAGGPRDCRKDHIRALHQGIAIGVVAELERRAWNADQKACNAAHHADEEDGPSDVVQPVSHAHSVAPSLWMQSTYRLRCVSILALRA